MKYTDYTNPEKWIGGFYELSIEYHPFGDNKKLNDALESMYKCDFFNGMWIEKSDYFKSPVPLPLPINVEEESVNLFYGTLSLTEDNKLPCVISVIRISGESDWLDISIPQAILGEKFHYKYPLTKELNPWLSKIVEMYAKLAESIFKSSPFNIAIIGEEISGYTNEANITINDLENVTLIMPSQLQTKLGLKRIGKELSNNLRIFN